ncbi:MAG: site-specific DNA-methyltransferase [Actinobacteria bacterium]|nr:site-specific DNA-methyltransferase [Actinomycetota bacterium]
MSVRLEWDGKPNDVERIRLPFQTVETINQSRATRDRDSGSLLATSGSEANQSPNQLIWGDNKLVMSSLLSEFAGSIDLIYVDPPFDTGADFAYRVEVGDETLEKKPSILEEHAYRDTWGRGRGSYLEMLYERLILMHELLSETGSLFVHLDWHQGHYVKVLLDEIFGADRFLNEIVWWYYNKMQGNIERFASNHDVLFWYSKSASYTFHRQREQRDKPIKQIKRVWDKEKQAIVNAKDPETGKVLYQESTERTVDDVWRLSMLQPADKTENVRYETQKPLTLARRVIAAATNEGDLVADFFVGSGTALVAAEELGRRWIGSDLGRFSIHTTRKRLLNIADCRPFEIKNLGAYERQRWQRESGNGRLAAYLDTILSFFRAEPVDGFTTLHGKKAGRMVHVGATDAPVTIDELEEVMDEMADNGIESCDVLGWEWEMGLHDTIGETARRRGLDLRPLQIPREIIEPAVREADAVRFFELAHVDLDVKRKGREVSVALKDFVIPSEELIPAAVREEIGSWSDLIDYWSVDFDYTDDTFHNQWQAYRTREQPTLARESEPHEYGEAGRHTIVVKIIDIFGNDTTKVAEVAVK